LTDPKAPVRADILAAFRAQHQTPSWPTVRKGRTLAQLHAAAKEIARQAKEKADADAARKRTLKLKRMAAHPDKYLAETEKLARERSVTAYIKIAELLADLRAALAGSAKSDLAERQARALKAAFPTLKLLNSELRKKGFLKK
jgi:prophage DNA circulation protein